MRAGPVAREACVNEPTLPSQSAFPFLRVGRERVPERVQAEGPVSRSRLSIAFLNDAAIGFPFVRTMANITIRPTSDVGVRSHTMCTWLPPPSRGVTVALT